jgi:hypothetical protein
MVGKRGLEPVTPGLEVLSRALSLSTLTCHDVSQCSVYMDVGHVTKYSYLSLIPPMAPTKVPTVISDRKVLLIDHADFGWSSPLASGFWY